MALSPAVNLLDRNTKITQENLGRIVQKLYRDINGIQTGQTTIVYSSSGSVTVPSGGGGSGVTLDYRSATVSVSTSGTYVTFSTPLAGTFQFGILKCVDTSGNTVGCKITGITGSGFIATPVKNAALSYFAVPQK